MKDVVITVFCITLCIIISHFQPCLAGSKPSLMMTPLDAVEVSESEAAILSDALLNSLVRTGAFQAVERRDLKELLDEMSLSLSDLMDQDAGTVEPGKLQSAQVACLGTVGKIGDTYVLQARCAEVTTGALMGSTSLRCSGSIDCLLDLTDRAARELAGLSPAPAAAPSGRSSGETAVSHKSVPSGTSPSLPSQHVAWSVVTNAEFGEFIAANGYTNKSYWTASGWHFCQKNHLTKPAYWNNPRLNLPDTPVTGISYYEAEAFCRWKGCRLPTAKEAGTLGTDLTRSFRHGQFYWTSDPGKAGDNCAMIMLNGHLTSNEKGFRLDKTGLVVGCE